MVMIGKRAGFLRTVSFYCMMVQSTAQYSGLLESFRR